MSIKDTIFSTNDITVEPVEVPEWGLTEPLYIKTVSAKDRDAYDGYMFREKDKIDIFKVPFLVKCICSDPEGKNLIFTEEDIPVLNEKSSLVINRLWDKAKKVNNLFGDDGDIEKK